ncbi:hypothetical protein CspeluHIS016_0401820 [Cutaneotrichosporon spelunceum]|uniref:P-type Cu(+) transporter n=1 Tax=Cutaneotrichosporon spelunceum TaxID=1672016 RepID=A0AAD3TVF6_9TREE|nr:hypothetical protein CspeluHIS016_0401820 [Cutaneotrichosporon spelunceum]
MPPSIPTHLPTASLLVGNMHCPSCVESITSLLSAFGAVQNLSVSLLLHRITFAVDTSIGSSRTPTSVNRVVEQVKNTLKSEGGFEVTDESGEEPKPRFFDRVFRKERTDKASRVAEERRRRHLEHCEACRAEQAALDSGQPPTLPALPPADQVLVTTLSIEGMTCASCTSSITNALESEPSILSVEINLLSSSGTIRHKATLAAAEVAELVDDVGFEAEVIESRPEASEPAETHIKTTLSIEGMTCASCSGAIDRAVRQHPDIMDVVIDVLLNKGVFTHKPALTPDALKNMVEDVGYDAEVVSSSRLEAKGVPGSRTVTVRVQGTFCNQCVDKINIALESMPLLSYTPVTLQAPMSTLIYIPRDPLTIRDILAQLTALAPEFDAEIVRSQSLSERSQAIQRREVKLLAAHLAVAVLFAIPTFIIAIVSMVLLKPTHPFRRFWDQPVWGAANLGTVVQWPLATVVQFGVGWIFYKRAFNALWPHLRVLVPPALRSKVRFAARPVTWRSLFSYGSMDLLVTLSTTVSYFASVAMMVLDVRAGPGSMSVGTYFDSSVFLIMFILLGRTIEAYAKSRTTDAVALLGNLRPATALLVDSEKRLSVSSSSDNRSDRIDADRGTHEIPIDHVEYGDVLLIPPGSLPPTDGTVVSGSSKFDESSLTGESLPVTKAPGDEVYTGTTNTSSPLHMRVTALAADTMLERIIQAVSDASGRKAPLEKAAERITAVFVPLVVYFALAVLAFWLGMIYAGHIAPHHYHGPGGRAFFALEFAIAVLVVACPCGIGLAVPCANAVGNGLAAAAGILASGGGEAFTAATAVTTIAFDKTGTLTAGKPTVTDEHNPATLLDRGLVRRALRDIEAGSTHPLAIGLVEHLSPSVPSDPLEVESAEIAGRGLRATAARHELLVGNAALLTENDVAVSPKEQEMLAQWSADAKSVVLCAARPTGAGNAFALVGMYALADAPRASTAAVLSLLRKRYRVVMLSGDNEVTARAVGAQLGFDIADVHAGVGPEGKAAVINEMQVSRTVPRFSFPLFGLAFGTKQTQERVMFVGDGLNDAVALAAADVSAAMGHGSQATLASADFVLLGSDLAALPKLLRLSRKVRNRQWFNLFWAMVFNTTFLPIAAGVLFPVGFRLSPVWSAVLMACSSVSVVLSSLALRWGV